MSTTADFVPNRALRRYILADERIVVATHRHWAKLWEPLLTTAGAFVLALALLVAVDPNVRDDMGWVWLPFLVLGARLLYKWLDWRAEWFVMTDRRLLLLDGFLVHRVAMMPSEKVTDLGYERTPMGQLLGYGTFIFETAGQDQALDRVTWIPRPDSRYRLIIANLFHPDAADAEAAAQGGPAAAAPAAPPVEVPPTTPPPALMPRIGRRSNPPTQRIELPVARIESGVADTPADTTADDENLRPTAGGLPGMTGAPAYGAPGGASAGAAASGTFGGTTPGGSDPAPGTPRDGAHRDASHRDAGHHDGGHVPGGPTAATDAPELRPKPFIEGGDPKIR
ncbi:PH domain-containing protein [Promicromonospora sp. MS192]|uniref:PH domain-containing protein n=1 Tax=Promicromonospora sp. MS192 TaxID=3412684 RepID=UPI003C2B8334